MDKCYFKVPNELDQQIALGSLAGENFKIKKILKSIIPFYKSIPMPTKNDWLFDHEENGQPYDIYKNNSQINWFEEKRNTIFIQPLEVGINQVLLQTIKKFCKTFYRGAKVKLLHEININNLQVEHRINEYTEKIQYNARQIIRQLEQRVQDSAYCLIGVLLSDLYPQDDWNFVYGLASNKNRVGVFSFARYDESFFLPPQQINPQIIDFQSLAFKGSKVMIHEIGHMFGLKHCIYYSCLMNGVNNQQEYDQTPHWICPVCIRKLQSNLKFNLEEWFLSLLDFCQKNEKFADGIEFYEQIILSIQDQLKIEKKESN